MKTLTFTPEELAEMNSDPEATAPKPQVVAGDPIFGDEFGDLEQVFTEEDLQKRLQEEAANHAIAAEDPTIMRVEVKKPGVLQKLHHKARGVVEWVFPVLWERRIIRESMNGLKARKI